MKHLFPPILPLYPDPPFVLSISVSLIFNHDCRHSKALIVSLPNRDRRSLIVTFVLENSLLGSADMPGIDKKSKATLLKFG